MSTELYFAAVDLSATAADIAADIADGRACPDHLDHARALVASLDAVMAASRPGRPATGLPPIVCLCGSTRFASEFRRQNLRLTLAGEIVLSIGCDARQDDDRAAMAEAGDLAAVKARLDELHKRKIDLASYVLVINPGGYIGESTRSEIRYALAHGKPVRYLEPPGSEG
jgi:hypothetical protein